MLQKTANKLRMYEAVWLVLQKFIDVWKDNAGFKEIVDKFELKRKEIEAITGPSETKTSGVTDDKEQMREDLTDTIMEISGPFSSMAHAAGNNELEVKVKFTDSQLDDLLDPELAATGKSLASLATQNAEVLKKYGIQTSDVTALDTLSKSFADKTAGSREAITGRSASKQGLGDVVRETSRLLKKEMNGVVIAYRRKNTLFHTEYFNARKIVQYGVRHEKKEVKKS